MEIFGNTAGFHFNVAFNAVDEISLKFKNMIFPLFVRQWGDFYIAAVLWIVS